MAGERYEIKYTQTAIDLLNEIHDGRIKRQIHAQIKTLKNDPVKQGKPLRRYLQGLLSVRVRRYRVVYAVDTESMVVTIWGAGIRKEGDKSDIYRVIGRLLSKLGFRGRS